MRLSSALTLLLPLAIASTASAAKVKIVWWDPYGPPFSEPTKAMVAAFNKTHPHINVVREISGGAEISKLAVAMASGKGPGCAHIFASWSASQLWALGHTRYTRGREPQLGSRPHSLP